MPYIGTEPTTFARTITVCSTCGGEVRSLALRIGEVSAIEPCGHSASMTIKPNPLLGNAAA